MGVESFLFASRETRTAEAVLPTYVLEVLHVAASPLEASRIFKRLFQRGHRQNSLDGVIRDGEVRGLAKNQSSTKRAHPFRANAETYSADRS